MSEEQHDGDIIIDTYRNTKLDLAAEEALTELKRANISNIGEVIKSIFKTTTSSKIGLPLIADVLNGLKALEGLTKFGEYLKIKKYVELFVRLDEVSNSERTSFFQDLDNDLDLKERYTATISTIVDNVAEMEKVGIISNLIKARMRRKIRNEDFFRFMHFVSVTTWYDIFNVYLIVSDSDIPRFMDRRGEIDLDHLGRILLNAGFTSTQLEITTGELLESQPKWNDLGKRFVHAAFEDF